MNYEHILFTFSDCAGIWKLRLEVRPKADYFSFFISSSRELIHKRKSSSDFLLFRCFLYYLLLTAFVQITLSKIFETLKLKNEWFIVRKQCWYSFV